MGNTKRLLLLELVTQERWVHNSRLFPFILGGAEQLGVEARWLCFGAHYKAEKRGRAEIDEHLELTEADISTLANEVERFKPTHLLFSDPISRQALDTLSAQKNDVDLLSMSMSYPRFLDGEQRIRSLYRVATGQKRLPEVCPTTSPGQPRPHDTIWIQSRTDWLLQWLGVEGRGATTGGSFLVDACQPSYDAVMANSTSRSFEPHIIIMGGVSCDHFSRVDEVDFYSGLDLSQCQQLYGCGYCTHYRGSVSELDLDPVEVALRQLVSIHETAGMNGRCRWQLEFYDIRLFGMLDRLFSKILELDLPPSTFWFEPRIDRFLESESTLDRLLGKLASAGHTIGLLRMGAENLVDEENARFNKKITLDQIDRAQSKLKEISEAHRGSFVYDPTFGYITCSPWTSFEALEEGIDRAIERSFSSDDIWLYTPLLLYHGSPITLAAEREGDIITEVFEDLSLLYEAAINHVDFSTIRPWRFKDERVGVAFGLIVRFYAAAMRQVHPDTIFQSDELYEHLLLELDRGDAGDDRPDLFAREVVTVVKRSAPPYSRKEILSRALAQNRRVCALIEIAEAMISRFGGRFGNLRVRDVRSDGMALCVRVELESTPTTVLLYPKGKGEVPDFETEHWSVSCCDDLRSEKVCRALKRFIPAFDLAVARTRPKVLLSRF